METLYIDNTPDLESLCQRLSDYQWIALDTEFMREKTYYPKLCLLQIGTPDFAACIDPLALENLDPVLDLVYRKDIVTVMHAGGQDLEIFYHLRKSLPPQLFDTQIAAPLLGYPEQAGYARLVEDIAGVRLDKAHTRADWSHRPLTPAQIKYAADDVIYLCEIYVNLRDNLQQRNRLQWLEHDFAQLSDPSRYQQDPDLAWKRVKSARKLRGAQLSILKSLAAWREQSARTSNIPRGWLLKDDVLTDLSRQRPDTLQALGRIRGINEKMLNRHGKLLLKLISDASSKQPPSLPDDVRKQKPDVAQEAVIDLLNAVVHLRAHEQQLSPVQLASRRDLQSLVMGEEVVALRQGWRKNLIGDELMSVLDGQVYLSVRGRELHIETVENHENNQP